MGDVVIIRFTSLGDLVTNEPLLRAIQHFHPDDRVTLVTSGLGEELYAGRFHRIVVPDGGEGNIWRRAGRLKRRVSDALEGRRVDTLYDLQASSLSLLLAKRLRARHPVYASTRLWQKLLGLKDPGKPLPRILEMGGATQSASDAFFRDDATRLVRLTADEDDRTHFREHFKEGFGERPVAVIAPGASGRWRSKHWGDARFTALAGALLERGFGVAVVGSALERAAAAAITTGCSRMRPTILDFTARTSVRQLMALIGEAALFVGNDSGPAHIAAGMGTATVTLFGPTAEKHCVGHYPYRGRHRCIAPHDVACHPCYKPECPTQGECMASISVGEVLDACLALYPSPAQPGDTLGADPSPVSAEPH